MNRLYFGDNLEWLRNPKEFPDASVDLVYLDPPFNSNADYNVLFREASGAASQAQFHAFTDTWSWADAAETYHQFIDTCPNVAVVEMMEAFHSFLKNSPMMAYLAMMAPRLVELNRVLKETGSLYLHCDDVASHHLKLVLDTIFGSDRFRNEIVWKRTSGHSDAVGYGRVHDAILFYVKSDHPTWNSPVQALDAGYVEQYYRYKDENGRRWMSGDASASGLQGGGYEYEWKGVRRLWRFPIETMTRLDAESRIFYTRNGIARVKRYLDENKGIPAQDMWSDIEALRSWHQERLGYDTQKPQALLERIISASSNPGDIVLDPFCGCGTTIHAAQKLGREWIGIDVTYLAINLIKRRLRDAFGEDIQFEEKGQPTDFESARRLAELDKFQFQHWALSLIGARPLKEGEGKGADRGVDGLLYFYEAGEATPLKKNPSLAASNARREKIIVQVKGGGVKRSDIATLLGDVNNQKAIGGVLITLDPPTKPMRDEAVDAGRFKSKLWHERDYPKIQIATIAGLLDGTERLDLPPQINPFAMAAREATGAKQAELL